MRRLSFILSFGFAFLVGCREQPNNISGATLKLYVVQATNVGDGRYIDTPEFPKLGYVAAAPDMTITGLEVVALESPGDRGLRIRMRAEDRGKFAALTERAIGQRLLMMLDDELLMAPNINSPVPNGAMMITLSAKADARAIEARLQAMAR